MKHLKTILLSFMFITSISISTAQETSLSALNNNGTGAISETFIGNQAGQNMLNNPPPDHTYHNTFIGAYSGMRNTTGNSNTFIGSHTGDSIVSGNHNVFLGSFSGHKNNRSRNTFLGFGSGSSNRIGSGNVFIGHQAGQLETRSNKLYIDNSNTDIPLIYGDFTADKVGIATTNFPATIGGVNISAYKLFVPGGILTEQVRVRTGWADYVFDPSYDLQPLSKVETYIKENGHLPNVPSAKEVQEQGLEMGEITKIQQEKIEELTLYIIAQEKRIAKLEAIITKK